MTTNLSDVLEVLETTYPPEWAEPWDRSGLVLGDLSAPVERVLLAVDPTCAVAEEAVRCAADLLVTHHPLLLRGANFLPTDTGKGAVVTTLLRGGSALWCGHTNVDRSSLGTVGAWIRALDLQEVRPLDASGEVGARAAHGSSAVGLGAVGTVPTALTVRTLAEQIARVVPQTAQGVRYTGDPDRPVRSVAVCPGAGDSELDAATTTGADVYVTSDLRHHPALEHVESRAEASRVPALIDVAHAASEALWLPLAQELLARTLPDLEVRISAGSTDPWSGRVG